MKLLVLLFTLLLASCTTASTPSGPTKMEALLGLEEVVRLASEGVSPTLYNETNLEDLLISSDYHLLTEHTVPGINNSLALWREEVISAFNAATSMIGPLAGQAIATTQWEDPIALVSDPTSQATMVAALQNRDELTEAATHILKERLAPSHQQWQVVRSRWSIWREAMRLFGEEELSDITVDPIEHLIPYWISTTIAAIVNEEHLLRTTQRVKGSGSPLEVFQ
jgi:hypothetical protein